MTQEKLDINKVRLAYPHPKSAQSESDRGVEYCVFGALRRHLGFKQGIRFPRRILASETLQQVNSRLTPTLAYVYAGRIVRANDSGNFSLAWDLLEIAVSESGSS